MPLFTSSIELSADHVTIRPTLDLNFAATKTLDHRITFMRGGLGTYTDHMGVLKYASNNVPRFDHNFSTGESLGLLIEESSTNITRNSENPSVGSNWNQFGSISANIIEAPDGSLTADKLEAPTSGYGLLNVGASWTAGVPHTFSIFAKSAEFNKIGIRIYDGTSYFIRTNVNLDTGETVPGNNGAGTLKVEKFANGWWRICVTGTPVSTYTYATRIVVEPHSNAIVQNADPSSSQEGIYIWGWQWEAKSCPTSYIPTNGVEVTRAADIAKITGTNFTNFYNQEEGTLVLSADIAELSTSNQAAVVFEDTSSQSTDLIAVGYRVGGGGSGNLGSWYQGNSIAVTYKDHNAGITANTEFRQAFAYKKDDLAASVNGGTPLTDSSGTLSTSIDRVRFGEYYADGMIAGHIKSFKYYNKRLPNAQLQSLTEQ